jgi:hypothetical protein
MASSMVLKLRESLLLRWSIFSEMALFLQMIFLKGVFTKVGQYQLAILQLELGDKLEMGDKQEMADRQI